MGLTFSFLICSCSMKQGNIAIIKGEGSQRMIRLTHPPQYLLLPIQEDANESRFSVQNSYLYPVPLHIRLADKRVDYYVPFELPPGLEELDIVIDHLADNAIAWKEIKLSDQLDDSNREKFRPLYHFTPKYGWMNDPNGMVYLDGEYHLFYQYNPYGSMWGNMHWGHAVTKDLVTWEHLPVAISPDSLGTIFSGNCVVDKENVSGFGKDAIVAFYTSAGEMQTQSIAYSNDKGRTFHKYGNNPVLKADIPDFRDPNVFYHEPTGKWIMVVAAGQEIWFYSSANLRDWVYESTFGEGYGNHGGVWECPDLLELAVEGDPSDKRWVLLVNINPGGIFGGSATQYFTGTFDGKAFSCESTPETTKWMDWGKDHYATVTWANAPEGRAIALAWMSNWQYANEVPTQQYRSANSVPREIALYLDKEEAYLLNFPVKELEKLRGEPHEMGGFTVDKSYNIETLLDKNEGTYEIEVELENIHAEVFGFKLFNGKGEYIDLYYNLPEHQFCMDRTKSGLTGFSRDFPAVTAAPVERSGTYTLRIYVDSSSVECFAGDGKFVMTNLVFPDEPYNRMSFYSKGGAGKFDVKCVTIYPLTTGR